MIRFLYSVVCAFVCVVTFAQTPHFSKSSANRISEGNEFVCDSIMIENGYNIHFISANGLPSKGLYLFSQNMKDAVDKELLDYIEISLYKRTMDNVSEDRLSLISGHITDFKRIDISTPCTVTENNAKEMIAEWIVEDEKVIVSIPIGYDVAKNLSRSEIENQFIFFLKDSDAQRIPFELLDNERLEPYGEKLYILQGDSYQSKDITRNTYFCYDRNDCLSPVWDSIFPLESVSNMFIYPSNIYGNVQVELTILKHEYGEKEIIVIPLYKMLAACEHDGCVPFWGVEKFDNGNLEGALFLYNQQQGYDHVMRVKMNPTEVIEGNGNIKVRASLFIPTNNVYNLFQPYVRKAEKDRIKIDL